MKRILLTLVLMLGWVAQAQRFRDTNLVTNSVLRVQKIVYPDGTEQTSAVGLAGSGSLSEIRADGDAETNVAVLEFAGPSDLNFTLSNPEVGRVVVTISPDTVFKGPPGAGNVTFHGYWSGTYGTNVGYPTGSLVSYDGQIFYALVDVMDAVAPVHGATWQLVVLKGADGDAGTDLSFYTGWTSGDSVDTNQVISHNGSLWIPVADNTTSNPTSAPGEWSMIVSRGTDGADASGISGLSWAGIHVDATDYLQGDVVSYGGQLYYADDDITADLGTPANTRPGTHVDWILIVTKGSNGSSGVDGADGADGLGNLLYDSLWDSGKTYAINTIVHYDGALYRAKVETTNARPDLNYPGTWDRILWSGQDANVTEWIFHTSYNSALTYENALVRHNGAVYSTKGSVPINTAPPNATYWDLFVTDDVGLPSGVQGNLVYHNGTEWVVLAPGTSGQVLETQGAGANPQWNDVSGLPSGVQGDVAYHNGTAWVVLNAGTSGQVFTTQGAGANPIWATSSSFPSGTQGDVVYYNGTDWVVLNAGTSGHFLRTNGVGANPGWAEALSDLPSGVQGDLIYHNGAAWAAINAGTSGQFLKTMGAGANPVWDTLPTDTDAVVINGTSVYNSQVTDLVDYGTGNVILYSASGTQKGVYGTYNTIAGGRNHNVYASSISDSVIGGGYQNTIGTDADASVIGGGQINTVNASADFSVIGGGYGNATSSNYSTVGGGYSNNAGNTYATVAGGYDNDAVGSYSFAAGYQNYAGGSYSVAMGRQAHAVNTGSFVFGDRTAADVSSDRLDQAKFRVNGGFTINNSNGNITIWGVYPTASLPTADATGDLVFDSTAAIWKYWDGASWSAL